MEVHVIETGGGVAAAAESFDLAVEITWLQPFTPLEHHVLEKVSHALFTALFPEAAPPAPEIKADETGSRKICGHQGAAVCESEVFQWRTG